MTNKDGKIELHRRIIYLPLGDETKAQRKMHMDMGYNQAVDELARQEKEQQ